MIGLYASRCDRSWHSFVLRIILARVTSTPFVVNVDCAHLDEYAADTPGVRVPGHKTARCAREAEPFPKADVLDANGRKPVRQSQAMPTVFTVGHSTRTIAEFVALLRQATVDLLVDVRSVPRSRANPRFNADALPETLAGAGITYRHLRALGGLRHRTKGAMPSP